MFTIGVDPATGGLYTQCQHCAQCVLLTCNGDQTLRVAKHGLPEPPAKILIGPGWTKGEPCPGGNKVLGRILTE